MIRIDWDDPEPVRNHHGSNQTFQSGYKFMSAQTEDGWEVLVLGQGGSWNRLYLASGMKQACRLMNALRGIICDLWPGDAKILQAIRPQGWRAPLWMNPCERCGTVDKATQSVLCEPCRAM